MMEIDMLAHEIINPLNIIVGCAELTQAEATHLKNDKIINYLETIVSESMKCCSLLEQQIVEKKNDDKKYKVDLKNLVYKVVKSLKGHPLLKNRLIEFKSGDCDDINAELPVEDRCYLKIIINNMIMNAIKHSSLSENIIIRFVKSDTITGLEIENKVKKKKEIENIFTKSNYLGLNIIDSLVRKLNYEWNLTQDGETIITSLNL